MAEITAAEVACGAAGSSQLMDLLQNVLVRADSRPTAAQVVQQTSNLLKFLESH